MTVLFEASHITVHGWCLVVICSFPSVWSWCVKGRVVGEFFRTYGPAVLFGNFAVLLFFCRLLHAFVWNTMFAVFYKTQTRINNCCISNWPAHYVCKLGDLYPINTHTHTLTHTHTHTSTPLSPPAGMPWLRHTAMPMPCQEGQDRCRSGLLCGQCPFWC